MKDLPDPKVKSFNLGSKLLNFVSHPAWAYLAALAVVILLYAYTLGFIG